MGYNFSVACHKHQCRVDIIQGYETQAIRGFYEDHIDCYKENSSNLEIAIDNNISELKWLEEGFYDSEVFPPTKMHGSPSWRKRLKSSDLDRKMIKKIRNK